MLFGTRYDYEISKMFNVDINDWDALDEERPEIGGMTIGDFETLANQALPFPGICIYCEDYEELAFTVDSMLQEIFETKNEYPIAFFQNKSDGIYLAIKVYDVYAVCSCDIGGYGYGMTLSYFDRAENIENNQNWEELL